MQVPVQDFHYQQIRSTLGTVKDYTLSGWYANNLGMGLHVR
jgi:hypothetical protein